MSRNGKGDGNRIGDQRKFNAGHQRSYGKTEKLDGRKTIVVVRNGQISRQTVLSARPRAT